MVAPLWLEVEGSPGAFTSSLIFIPYSYLEILGHWWNIMDTKLPSYHLF